MTKHEIESRLAELDDEIAAIQMQVEHGGTSPDLRRDLTILKAQREAERDRLTAALENFD